MNKYNWPNTLLLIIYAFSMDMHYTDFQLLPAHMRENPYSEENEDNSYSQSEAKSKEWGRPAERIASFEYLNTVMP